MPHAGLGGEVDDGVERAVAAQEVARRHSIGEIDGVAVDAERSEQRRDAVALEARVVVGVELVAADDAHAGPRQAGGDVRADEARRTGH